MSKKQTTKQQLEECKNNLKAERAKNKAHCTKISKMLKLKDTEIFRLKSILDSIPGSIYWKDKNGVYLGRNSYSSEKMAYVGLENEFGIDDVIGKTDYDLFPKETADRYRKYDLEVLKTGKEISNEEPVTLPNGKILIQLSTKRPLRNEKKEIIGIIGNTVDITYQKEIEQSLREAKEQAEEASRTKTGFIRNMEHDIRTPFTGVWGIANYLWNLEKDEHKKELLGDVTQSAKQLLDYCNSILDFAKTESSALPIFDKKFNLEELVKSVIEMEKPAARHKKLKLNLQYAKNIPTFVIGDSYRLKRVLMNLIGNAIKFTNKGSVSLKIKRVKGKGECLIQFIVSDTGIGIPKEQHDYIFEKFSKISPSSKGKYRGLGLGLRIVKQFVNEMDGEIDLKSKANQGTTFACTFPFKIPLTEEQI